MADGRAVWSRDGELVEPEPVALTTSEVPAGRPAGLPLRLALVPRVHQGMVWDGIWTAALDYMSEPCDVKRGGSNNYDHLG